MNIDLIFWICIKLIYVYMIIKAMAVYNAAKKNGAFHKDIIQKIMPLCYAITIVLFLNLAETTVRMSEVKLQIPTISSAYSIGYNTGYYGGFMLGEFFKDTPMIFAVALIWLLKYVLQKAIIIKDEQDLTV